MTMAEQPSPRAGRNGFWTGVQLVFAGIALIVWPSLLMALPVWLLWNWLMPVIFNLPEITFFQALGLLLLSGLLFHRASSPRRRRIRDRNTDDNDQDE